MMPMRSGCESVFRGARPHHPDGALRVAQFDGMVVARTQPVLQHESGNAQRVKPLGHRVAFLVHGEILIASAGADHHGRARAAAFRQDEGRERWLVLRLRSERAGSARRPQQFGLRLLRQQQRRRSR